jgi:Molecular chaperone GrpE (heat shock protein)
MTNEASQSDGPEADVPEVDEEEEESAATAEEPTAAVLIAEGEYEAVADRVEPDSLVGAEALRAVAAELSAARERIDELESSVKRVQADFQNYKKRMGGREAQVRKQATAAAIERVVEVRDNLVRALAQDAAADIRPGVESTLEAFDGALEAMGVEVIAPMPGDEVDPHRHEVLARVPADSEPGTVADVARQGYLLDEKVIQTAQVTVSDDE